MFQENSIETRILSRVKKITSPGWMHETSAWTWCTGKTQRDRVEREVGGGIGMGNTCKPMALSFQCMTKSTTNKKKIIYHIHVESRKMAQMILFPKQKERHRHREQMHGNNGGRGSGMNLEMGTYTHIVYVQTTYTHYCYYV